MSKQAWGILNIIMAIYCGVKATQVLKTGNVSWAVDKIMLAMAFAVFAAQSFTENDPPITRSWD